MNFSVLPGNETGLYDVGFISSRGQNPLAHNPGGLTDCP